MSGVSYFWTKDNAYCIVLNTNSKLFNIDFFPSNIDRTKYSIQFNSVRFLRYWYNPGSKTVLIALKESTFLFVSDKIIMFKLEQGDMIVRPVSSRNGKFTAVMTRFHTLLFNEDSVMCHIVSKDNLRPAEFNMNFTIDENFDSKYASIWTEFNVVHDAKLTRLLLVNNL